MVKYLQYSNAPVPILVQLGNSTLDKDEQYINAPDPILVQLGNDASVKDAQL